MGKKEGEQFEYYENGELRRHDNYVNNEYHGEQFRFTDLGKIWHKENYVNGKTHGEQIHYHYENGQLKSEQKFRYGIAETEIIRWNPDGTILY